MTLKQLYAALEATPALLLDNIDLLPDLIKGPYLQFNSQRERDVFLTALLGILSGCIPGLQGRYYTLNLYPHLYVVITAPPGNSKSTATFAKMMGKPLHDARRLIGKVETEDEITKSTLPNLQRRKWGSFLAADTTAARFLQQLSENGSEGIKFLTEIDTLVNANGHEHGGFTTNYREAYQHEDISFSRKGEDIDVSITKPKLALVMTGTPEQMLKLIPSAENGLFSRNLFYAYKQEPGPINVRPKETSSGGFEEYFLEKGKEVVDMAAFMEAHPAEFKLTDAQWDAFNEFINEVITDTAASHGEDAHSSSMRIGIIMFRICMILSGLRKWERRDSSGELYCTDADFSLARSLSANYMKHTLTILEAMPKSSVKDHVKVVDKLFAMLPNAFQRFQAVNVGKQYDLPSIAVDRQLRYWVKCRALVKVGQGQYAKPSN